MLAERDDQERPCLHCMMIELIGRFFAEFPATSGLSDNVDTGEADEVIDAIAKTFAELTSQQDGLIRQQLIEQLMREIMNYDAEFRRDDTSRREQLSPSARTKVDGVWIVDPSPHPGQSRPPRASENPAEKYGRVKNYR
jgi:hypothetical protein